MLSLFSVGWFTLYFIVLLQLESPPGPWISFLLIPFVAGLILGVTLVGCLSSKMSWVASILAVFGVATVLWFAGDDDFAAGGGFVLLYVIAPVIPLVAGIGVAHMFSARIAGSGSAPPT